jgi:hypothetical protein
MIGYFYQTKQGLAEIRINIQAGRWDGFFDGVYLGNWHSPQQAAEDLARDYKVPGDIGDWG